MNAQDLKNSILQLAMEGKLVEQRQEEGNARELLQAIQEEKTRLVAEKKIKKTKPLSPVAEEEKPFDIPESWEWVRLGEITIINPKNHLDDNLEVSFIPMNLISDGYCNHYDSLERAWKNVKKGYTHFAEGDIGVAKITPCFQNRKSVIFVNLLNHYGAGTTELTIVRPIRNLMNRFFLLWVFKSFYFINNGIKTFSGTAGQQRINKDYIKNFLLPLPPLAEQKRIVAKIEELLPYVEEYDKAQTRLQAFEEKFPEDMKKSILQYAMEGKLVEQRKEEGTARELLQAIQEEKAKLVAEKKIKKAKPLPPVTEEKKPFDIPESWEWVRLGEISRSIQYGYNAPAQEVGRIKMVRISDIHGNKVDWNTVPYCEIDNNDIDQYILHNDDILFARTGGTVGKSYLVKGISEEVIYAGYLIRIRFSKNLSADYLKSFMESSIYWEQLHNGTIKTAQPNCNGQTLSKMVFPLPPLAEQKRIVAKIEELLPLVEKMQKK
ncbi:restriction endonuclease subunit S [Acidaminococcus fermentans]|uniref:restriction endonuclease subunit S n=1 Tax=Acidaminococcus fermentans TaxID=905 RepID=UPI003077D371